MTRTRTALWLAVNALLTLLAVYTAYMDFLQKTVPESRIENCAIGAEGIVAWIASFVVWRLRRASSQGALSRTAAAQIYALYAVGFAVSLCLYALRVLHSDYR